MTEAELSRLLVERDETLRKYVQPRIPRRMARLICVEDILQEIWITAFRSIHLYSNQGPDAFDKWLRTIARTRLLNAVRYGSSKNRAADRVVQSDRIGSASGLLGRVPTPGRTPSSEHACNEAVQAVRVAIDGLPDDYRRAVTMHVLDGRTEAEVATVMNKTPAAVHGLLYRALARLRVGMGSESRFFSSTRLESKN